MATEQQMVTKAADARKRLKEAADELEALAALAVEKPETPADKRLAERRQQLTILIEEVRDVRRRVGDLQDDLET